VEAKLASLCAHAVDEIKGGANILIISDRNMSATQWYRPALLALSAIHQHLVREGLRTTAVWWWKPARPASDLRRAGRLRCGSRASLSGDGDPGRHLQPLAAAITADKAIYLYGKACPRSCPRWACPLSYCGAQLDRLSQRAVDESTSPGTASRVEGIGVFEIAEETIRNHELPSATTPCSKPCWMPAAVRLARPWRRAYVDA
jgi:glutamate synthase (NADPH/NADH) large chain